jgi:RNA polymerase sigma-70 factor (ECF subfamily)
MMGFEASERGLDSAAGGPLEHLEAQDEAARIHAEVERLPERERELLRLKFQHGLSYQEMGVITGLSATNVGFLLHKAIRSLRQRLSAATPGPVRNECAS